jgi:uncharacterized C2H2 Zn-finger protein
MKGKELSTLFSSFNEAAVDEIIKAVTDPSVDPDMLCDEDKKFILHKTRVLTFGNMLDQTLRCPFCGKIHTYNIDYDNFELSHLDEDWLNEKITMPDGKVITKAIPTKADWNAAHKHKEKRGLPDSYSYLLLQAIRISHVDGSRKTLSELIDYLENLPGRDLSFLTRKLELKFGLDTTFTVECQSCHTDFTGGVGINADMFREYDNTL